MGEAAEAERAAACSVPRGGGWRPGARWARNDRSKADVAAEIAALPPHQRPPMRELGRRSEAAPHPFKPMRPDEAGACLPLWRDVPPVNLRGEGARDAPYPGHDRFFITGRATGALVARVAGRPDRAAPPPADHLPPLVTRHLVDGAMLIAAASPAARALGLMPGMALTQARSQVPGLDIRDADADGDRADLLALAIALARRWTPIVAVSGDDGLFLDLTGVAHLHGGEQAMARRLARLLARLGYAARIAVADTAGAAWGMARYGYFDTRRGGEEADPRQLHQLPVAALRLESRAIDLLKRLGVDTVGHQRFAEPIATATRSRTG